MKVHYYVPRLMRPSYAKQIRYGQTRYLANALPRGLNNSMQAVIIGERNRSHDSKLEYGRQNLLS